MRDIFDNVLKTDIFGRRLSKKQVKRDILAENKAKGKAAEETYRMGAALRGAQVERSPHGKDFIERQTDTFTGRVTRTTHVEVKSGNARLSKLQQRTKKKTSNYKVVRQNSLW